MRDLHGVGNSTEYGHADCLWLQLVELISTWCPTQPQLLSSRLNPQPRIALISNLVEQVWLHQMGGHADTAFTSSGTFR